jgi:Helix-turn-helix
MESVSTPSSAQSRSVSSQDPVDRLLLELRKLRQERRWPALRDIAEATGLPRATLSRWLNGGRVPHWDRLVVLLQFYGVESGSIGEDRWKQLWRAAYSAHRARCYCRISKASLRGDSAVTAPAPKRTVQDAGRSWAVVVVAVSPVHHEPRDGRHPLKYKYRGDRVELYTELPPSPDGWLAVRTPADPPGYKWMATKDLMMSPLEQQQIHIAGV